MADRINLDDPNAGLFGGNDPELSEEEMADKQLYEKNPHRVNALGDLCFDMMMEEIDAMDLPEEAKRKMIFTLSANSVLDLMFDSAPIDVGMDISFCFDMYLGVSLANKKFKVDLFKEHRDALMTVKRSDFPNDEAYDMGLREFEEKWWDLPQPLLDKRTPNDAILETLKRYGLTE
jgi:hypothetical protein